MSEGNNLDKVNGTTSDVPTSQTPNSSIPQDQPTTPNQSKPNKPEKEEKEKKDTLQKIIMLIIIIILILLLLRSCGSGNNDGNGDTPNPKKNPGLTIEDGSDWDGNTGTVFTEAVTEYTTIPGFSSIVVNEKNKEIQLYNYPENTVYFIYTITEVVDKVEVASFDTKEDADLYLAKEKKNLPTLYNRRDEDGNPYFVDAEDNVVEYHISYLMDEDYNVYQERSRLVHYTDAIAPNKAIPWNVYDTLGKGTYELDIAISTYDVNTQEQCYGATQTVDVTVQ